MRNKIVCALLVSAMTLAMVGCGTSETTTDANATQTEETTIEDETTATAAEDAEAAEDTTEEAEEAPVEEEPVALSEAVFQALDSTCHAGSDASVTDIDGNEIGTLTAGDEVHVLGYANNAKVFEVEVSEGVTGYVDATAIVR